MTYDLVQGSVNGETFLEFIQGKLVPEMLPYDGENLQSILVMNNCSIHHVQPVLETLRLMGILVLFLPPYSPDMNPIEEMFSSINSLVPRPRPKRRDKVWGLSRECLVVHHQQHSIISCDFSVDPAGAARAYRARYCTAYPPNARTRLTVVHINAEHSSDNGF